METNAYYVRYGHSEIAFRLNFKDRTTLAIHVHPDSSVEVDAPVNASLEQIKSKVIKRAKWIRKQQRLFDRYPPVLPVYRYISGESFRYLGRQYTLRVESCDINDTKLLRGCLYVKAVQPTPEQTKALVDTWYKNHSNLVLKEQFKECLKQVKDKLPVTHDGRFGLRIMKTRWGSCSNAKRITLNPQLISASKECIDYVIIHELCHTLVRNHTNEFYKILAKVLPDWQERKEKLEMSMEHRLF